MAQYLVNIVIRVMDGGDYGFIVRVDENAEAWHAGLALLALKRAEQELLELVGAGRGRRG